VITRPTDSECLEWLWRVRYSPDGERAACPKCARTRKFHRARSRPSYCCDTCGWHIHPMQGTIFHRSRIGLDAWFRAVELVELDSAAKPRDLQRETAVSYKAAARMLAVIRKAGRARADAADDVVQRGTTQKLTPTELLSQIPGAAEAVAKWRSDRNQQTSPGQNAGRKSGASSATHRALGDRLLTAASQVIAERGLARTRVSDVARELDVSTATVHYYYPTRDDLLLAAATWQGEELAAARNTVMNSPVDSLSRLVRLVELLIPSDSQRRQQAIAAFEVRAMALREPRYRTIRENEVVRWRSCFLATMEEGLQSGEFSLRTPPDELTERLMALIDGMALEVVQGYLWMTSDLMLERLLHFLEDEIGRPRSSLTEALLPA
jgi:AcrR family transcriptional regulator/transposase-like protein